MSNPAEGAEQESGGDHSIHGWFPLQAEKISHSRLAG
jgi:hypothetical protein